MARKQVQKQAPVHLTPRERQLIVALSEGMTRREIATEWGVSNGTIQNHMRMVHVRLGVKTSAAAIAVAFRLGML